MVDSKYQSSGIASVLSRHSTASLYLTILVAVADVQQQQQIFKCEHPVAESLAAVDIDALVNLWTHEESRVKHETAGFVAALRKLLISELRPLVYLGLTSSDLIDTATAMQWRAVWRVWLQPDTSRLISELMNGAHTQDQMRMGRTHGRLAEPVPIGAAYARAARDLTNVVKDLASHAIPGKLSGPVGEHNAALPPEVASVVAYQLKNIALDTNSSQIVDRHFYRRVAGDLIEVVAICEQLATLHRLSAIEGVDLFAESFDSGVQMGSSVMPFKRNPIRSERISGLARVARGNYMALLETWSTSWWERDLSNSSVERTAWWDLVQLCYFLVNETRAVIESGHWRSDLPDDYTSPVDELIRRQIAGEDPETVYRSIQTDHQRITMKGPRNG